MLRSPRRKRGIPAIRRDRHPRSLAARTRLVSVARRRRSEGRMATTATALPPLIRALLRPEAYPHPTGPVQLRETHLSWVLLAGNFAYKVKKPVTLGFADFSTRERRTAACADEIRLNRRLCPGVYLDLV